MILQIYGYEAPETALGWNLSTVRQQLITSLMTLGAFIGSNMIGFMAMKLGRIPCLWIATVLCCIANTVMMCTTGIGELYFGRLFIGISNGFFMTFSQLYIQETGPAKYRGFLVSSYQFFIALVSISIRLEKKKTPHKEGAEKMLALTKIHIRAPWLEASWTGLLLSVWTDHRT